MEYNVMITADRIKRRRLLLGLSQNDLGREIGRDQRQISKYERGVNVPSGDILMKLARALDTTSDYLLGLSDSAEHSTEFYDTLESWERELIRYLRMKPIDERLNALEVVRML